MKVRKLIPLLVLATLSGGLMAAEEPPQQIDLSKFPAKSVEDVVVPVPSEIFNVLDKLGDPNWRAELSEGTINPSSNRAQIALLLGTVIADGFIAVQAEDAERVKEIGRDVLRLAEAINVRDAVIARSKSITDKADKREWNAAKAEFDGALQDVRGAMAKLNDEDLAQLVSLGGWVRGTQVLTSVVDKNYSPEGAELLHQPGLIGFFVRRIDVMPTRLNKDDLVVEIHESLGEIRPLVGENDGNNISPGSVKKINKMTSDIVKSITAPE